MDCFHYPLDTETLLRKKRKLRRELLARNPHPLHKKIAILGGSTTNEVADQLGLFLLQYGIEAEFYQSEYAQYWQDAMFGTPELDDFHPDVIYIHTNWRNLTALPTTADSEAAIDAMLDEQYAHFETMWQALEQKFACPAAALAAAAVQAAAVRPAALAGRALPAAASVPAAAPPAAAA